MLKMLSNLTKAAVAVAVSPVALAVDVVTLPARAGDLHKGPFDSTAKVLSAAGECIKEAITPEKG